MKPNCTAVLFATLLGMCSLPSFAADTATTMCASTDKVVFSCPLGNGKKVVSMCASGDASPGHGRFYYAYGRPSAPELVYPAKNQPSDDLFMRSHLVYGGASGGTAYSFVKDGYKYIVYSIAGTGFHDGGIIVQRPGEAGVAKKMQCQSSKILESQDDDVIDATLKWKSDSPLATHGLPGTR
jgi:hypothetical protein